MLPMCECFGDLRESFCVSAREQLRRSRHSRTFLVESGTGELWSEMQTGKGREYTVYCNMHTQTFGRQVIFEPTCKTLTL